MRDQPRNRERETRRTRPMSREKVPYLHDMVRS